MTALAFLLVTVSLLSLLPLRIEAFTAVNLVRNGSFESLTALGLPTQTACSTSGTFGAYGCDNAIAYAMVPWQVQSTIDVLLDGQLSGQINCTDGRFCLDLDSDSNAAPGSVSSALSLTAGQPYRFMIDLGALDGSCSCANGLLFRNISVSVTDTITSASVKNWTAFIDPPGCRWLTNLTFDVTASSSDVTFTIASLNVGTACGPWIDNVRLWWLPCVDGSAPPVSGNGFVVQCADGWFVTSTGIPTPLTITGPIQGPLSVTALDIDLSSGSSAGSGALIAVDGVATLDGQITLTVDSTVQPGDSLVLINATDIVGGFASVAVSRPSARLCGDQIQDSQTLSVLLRACDKNGLKGWQIALIVIGIVLFVALVTVAVILATKRWLKAVRVRSARTGMMRRV